MAVKERIGYIYLLRNLVNGKGYVGQTRAKKVEARWNAHIKLAERGSAQLIHKAIRKYGCFNFSAEVIWSGRAVELNEKEQYFIDVHSTFAEHGGYNLTRGGTFGAAKSRTVIRKHVRAALRRWNDPNERLRQSKAKRVQWLDPDYRRAATQCQIGKKLSYTTKRKISRANTGKTASSATKVLLSSVQKQRYVNDPSLRYRVGSGNRGKHAPKSGTTKQNMRKSAEARWARTEEHAKASARQKGLKRKPHSEETRARMSATAKSRWQDESYRKAHCTPEAKAAVAASNKRRALERKLANAKTA